MAKTINIPKTHLIMGLCLPLAVLLGYFLAEPLDSGSMAVVVFVLVVLALPVMMKWHHPLLILSWNAVVNPLFLPGSASLWLVMAAASLLIAVLNRAVSPDERFIIVPSVTTPLLVLAGIVIVTAMMTGGFGLKSLGGSQYGGKRYFFLLGAIAGYFAFTSRRIPPHRAGLYAGLFFLSGVTAIIGDLAAMAGPGLYFLFTFFSPLSDFDQPGGLISFQPGIVRIAGLSWVSPAIYCYLLARFGIRGVLDPGKPFRMLVFFLALAAGVMGGYRSVLVMLGLTVMILFFLEGLHRTRFLPLFVGLGILGVIILAFGAERLPLSAQRALSVLPVRINPLARQQADGSSEWRLAMWKTLVPMVPQYLFRGKGYGMSMDDVFMAEQNVRRDFADPAAGAIAAGDYHNGPLSLLIPFGLYGTLAFIWFLFAGARVLYRNLKCGDPSLRTINALLLALFAARVVFFLFVFGSLYSDMAIFTGLLGLGVSLNGAEPSTAEAGVESEAAELDPEYSEA